MIYQIYNFTLSLTLILFSPYLLFRGIFQNRFRKELIERMGLYPYLPFKKTVWIHAASVGEVFCSIPLLKKIRAEFPNISIVMTTMTKTGREAARKHIPEIDKVLFLPIDHPLTVKMAIGKIDPRLLLIAETELWPNLIRYCDEKGIPVILFNGRISESSFQRYFFLRFFFKECLKHISIFLMQTKEDQERIIKIGASIDRTHITGNIKFDQPFPSLREKGMEEMGRSLKLHGGEIVLIGGSTHRGEEEILVNIFKDLRRTYPNLILLLAPRHLQRIGEIEQLLRSKSILWKRKTLLLEEDEKLPEVILLDTMGELINLYCLGTLVFIGGSLVPIGGHNPIEPLFFKRCVLFGPHMFHFSEISRHLVEEGGAIQVEGQEDLAFHLRRLISDEKARKEIGDKGYQFLQKHRGAMERIFEEIRPYLERDC